MATSGLNHRSQPMALRHDKIRCLEGRSNPKLTFPGHSNRRFYMLNRYGTVAVKDWDKGSSLSRLYLFPTQSGRDLLKLLP